MVDNGGIWDEQSFRDFEINRDKDAIKQLEAELAESRAEIERKNAELDTFLAEQQVMNEVIESKDKLIEQMLEALEMADELIDQLIIDNTDNYAEERAKIRVAIAAAKGEV